MSYNTPLHIYLKKVMRRNDLSPWKLEYQSFRFLRWSVSRL